MATSRACQVGACSCWWASSCSSSTTTAARSATGAHAAARVPTTVAPAAPTAQSRGWHRHGTPARRSPAADRRAHGRVGHEDEGVAPATRPPRDVDEVRGRRQPQHRARAGDGPGEQLVAGPVGRVRGARRQGGRPPAPGWRSGAGRRDGRPTAPRPSRPARAAPGRGPRPLRLASGRRATPDGRLDADGHDPPADPAAVELDPDHVPDAHLVPDSVRDQVVEGLVDRGTSGRTRTTSGAGSDANVGPEAAGFAPKDDAAGKLVADAIEKHGFKTDRVQKSDAGETLVYAQADQPKDVVIVRLNDQMLVNVANLKTPKGWVGEMVEENGFFPI